MLKVHVQAAGPWAQGCVEGPGQASAASASLKPYSGKKLRKPRLSIGPTDCFFSKIVGIEILFILFISQQTPAVGYALFWRLM